MRILFCDDEPIILEQLQGYVRDYFENIGQSLPEFAAYTSGDELLQAEKTADLAFLDVEMPGQSGIYVGSKLKERNPRIKIFIVTSFPDYLDEAMRFQVFRYLSKPIDKARLFRNLKDALYQYSMDTKEIPIRTLNGILVLPADEIVCVETLSRKTFLCTREQEMQTLDGIDHWRKELSLPCFYSSYRSFIINMRYVFQVKKDAIVLRYGDKTKEAYLARRKYTDFKNTYLLYLESIR